MDLLICGTAAAEGWPALFCACAVCQEARRRGGKDLRTRTGFSLGDAIRIDFGPDSFAHMLKYDLDYSRLRHLLMSHSHHDHWVPHELNYRKRGFSNAEETLHVYGNARVREVADQEILGRWGDCRMEFHEIRPWETIHVEPGVDATPILAAHDPKEMCVNYILQTVACTLLQGHDTGWYSDKTWEFLASQRLDVVLMDSTSGKADSNRGHLSCNWVVKAKEKMEQLGALNPGARFIATHFSHNGGWLHQELEAYYQPHGIEVAYDGLLIPLSA